MKTKLPFREVTTHPSLDCLGFKEGRTHPCRELPTEEAQVAHTQHSARKRCLHSPQGSGREGGRGLALLWTPGKLERSPDGDGPRLPTAHCEVPREQGESPLQ